MAQRRMVSVKIIDSAKFIKMPVSCQSLYFHLIARADDDGVVEAFNVMRMVGASEDDLKILVAKQFATVLNEDLVTFINDWNEHNLIRADRKIDSIYQELLLQIVGDAEIKHGRERADRRKVLFIEENSPNVVDGTSQGQPNVSIGKDSIVEFRIEEESKEEDINNKDIIIVQSPTRESIPYQSIVDMFHMFCETLPRVQVISDTRKKNIKARWSDSKSDLATFELIFKNVHESDFLSGRNGKWTACNFDWIMKQANFIKIGEGNYENKGGTGNVFADAVKKMGTNEEGGFKW